MKKIIMLLAAVMPFTTAWAQEPITALTCEIDSAIHFVPAYILEIKSDAGAYVFSFYKTLDRRKLPFQAGFASLVSSTDRGQDWTLTLSDGRLLGTLSTGTLESLPVFTGILPVPGSLENCRQN